MSEDYIELTIMKFARDGRNFRATKRILIRVLETLSDHCPIIIDTLSDLNRDVTRARDKYEAPRRGPVGLDAEEIDALDQIKDFLDRQVGKSHMGYFGPGGWAGGHLDELLKRARAQSHAP
jgi:hypothetical protein